VVVSLVLSTPSEFNKEYSKSVLVLVINIVVYIVTGLLHSTSSLSLGFRIEYAFYLVLFTLLPILLVVVHVVAITAVTGSISYAIFNRLCLYFQMALLEHYELSFPSTTREVFSILLGVFTARFIVLRLYEKREGVNASIQELIKSIGIRKPSTSELLRAAPTLLSSHSIGFSLFILLYTAILSTRGIAIERATSALSLHLYIQSILLSISLLCTSQRAISEVALLGFFSGVGVLGVPSLVTTLPKRMISNKQSISEVALLGFFSGVGVLGVPSLVTTLPKRMISNKQSIRKVFYTEPVGIFLGVAEAEMIYGKPRGVYTEISQEHILSAQGRETWFFRRTDQHIYVKLEDLNTPHIVIIGVSGTGKTTLVKHLVLESSGVYGYRFLIIDPHGEYSDLAADVPCKVIDASKYSINPLVLENVSPRDRALQLSHVIASIFKLGFIQRKLLEEVIMKAYANKGITERPETWSLEPPTLKDLVKTCKELSELNPEYLRVLPYLSLISESLGEGQPLSVGDLLQGNSIVDLSKVSSDFAKAILVETLLYMIINRMYRAKRIPLQLVIDEIRHVMPRALGMELLSRIFMESRKFGFSTIVVSQDIKRIPKALLNNAGLRVIFALNEPESIKIAAGIIGGAVKTKSMCVSEALRSLKQYKFLVHATGSENTYIIRLERAQATQNSRFNSSGNNSDIKINDTNRYR